MSSMGKAASLFALVLVSYAVVSESNMLAAIKVQTTTPADEIRAYKLMNIPPNSTGSCKSRFGEGALAGKLDCECRGGYKWNAGKTQCVSDGTPQDISYFDRLSMRILRVFGAGQSSSVAPTPQVSPSKTSAAMKPAGCFVLATVSDTGDKFYFVPGCPTYEDIELDKSRDEKRFCSEQLAENAGWRKSPMCD